MNKLWICNKLVLKIIKFLFINMGSLWVKSNCISALQDYFRKSIEAFLHYFGNSLLINLLLSY